MTAFPCSTLIIYLPEHERHLNMMNDFNQHPIEDKVPKAKCPHADMLSVSTETFKMDVFSVPQSLVYPISISITVNT